MGKRIKVKVIDIELWGNNPRGVNIHEKALSQKQIIDSFFSSPKKIKEMKNLALDILTKGLLPTNDPCIWENKRDGKFIAIDGNRRIVSMKLLLSPELIKHDSALYDFYSCQDNTSVESKIDCYVTSDYAEALSIAKRVHLGPDDGRGLIPWNSKEKNYFNSDVVEQTNNKISNSYILRTKYPDMFDSIVERLKATSIDRIIGYSLVKNTFGISDYSLITREQAENLLKYINLSEKYQNKHNILLSRFTTKDAQNILNIFFEPTISGKPIDEQKDTLLPKLKIKNDQYVINAYSNKTIRLEEYIINKGEFTKIEFLSTSSELKFSKNTNIISSNAKPGIYAFKVIGYLNDEEIDSLHIHVQLSEEQLPCISTTKTEKYTLVAKNGYSISIESLNRLINEINGTPFDKCSTMIAISLRYLMLNAITILFNKENCESKKINFNNLKDALLAFRNKLKDNQVQNLIERELKGEKHSVNGFLSSYEDEKVYNIVKHACHTSTEQIPEYKILDLARTTLSTILVYISVLLNNQ